MSVVPLPYSAFPEELAHHVGVMTVAFQRIEDEVAILFEEVSGVGSDVAGVLLRKLGTVSSRLDVIRELSKVCVEDAGESGLVRELCKRVDEVRRERNKFVHSANQGFNKQTGEVHQLDKRSKAPRRYTGTGFVLLINRMYLLIDALESRREGAEPWHASLQHWDDPQQFWQ